MAESSFSRSVKTVSVCCSFVALGMVFNIIGPTILELQCALDVTYDQVTMVLPARASGHAFGSLLIGVFHEYVNPIPTMAVSLLTMGALVILLPLAKSLTALLALAFMCLIGGGVLESIAHTFILYMWGKEGERYMQLLHFAFGLGSLVAPLLASPFLSAGEVPIEGLRSNVTDIAIQCDKATGSFYISYAIIGAFSLSVSMVFFYLSCFDRVTEEHPSRLEKRDDSMAADKDSIWYKRAAIFVAALFLFNAGGLEIGMGTFITSFVVLGDLQLSQQVGAYMTSLFWFTYTFFRLFAIVYVDKIRVELTILLDIGILVIANVFLLPFGNSVEWCLWVGLAIAGIGLSTMWPSTFSLLENHFPITGGASSFLILSICLGEWVYPVIMGYAFATSAQLYLWVIFACTVLCFLLFIVLCFVLKATVAGEKSPLKPALADYGSLIADTGSKPDKENEAQIRTIIAPSNA
ncbi:Major facilitator superfamily domain-containing protein 4A [Halotydeus destructor]|nr:Major facilitator superfamily domain-containing protein 4A [Halotydeus destructor]